MMSATGLAATKSHAGLAGLLLSPAPEDRLMLLCARQRLSEGSAEAVVELLQGPIDWDALATEARRQRLAGLLFHHLRQPPFAALVPPQALTELRNDYLQATGRNHYYRARLSQMVAALEEGNIPVIVLKGAALVETVYEEPGLRPMADLDLLVPESRAREAQDAVRSLGFRPGGMPEDWEDTERNHRHLPILVGIGTSIAVEVHRHIVRLDSPLHFDIAGFWSRAQEVETHGMSIRVLCPEDMLLHLCVNFFLDRRFTSAAALGQLCDIAEVARRYDGTTAWDDLVRSADEYGLRGPVACALRLAGDLLDAPVPEGIAERLWPAGLDERKLASFAAHRVLGTEPWVARELVRPRGAYHLGTVLRAAVKRLVPSRRYMVSRYGHAQGRASLMYLARLGQAARMFVGFMRRPSTFADDVAIDRWLHTLYEGPEAHEPVRRAEVSQRERLFLL